MNFKTNKINRANIVTKYRMMGWLSKVFYVHILHSQVGECRICTHTLLHSQINIYVYIFGHLKISKVCVRVPGIKKTKTKTNEMAI